MPGGEGKVEVAISVISPISRSRLALKGGKGGITQRERERERDHTMDKESWRIRTMINST